VTGTADKLLVKLTNSGAVVRSAVTDTSGVVGIVLAGTGGASGTARVTFNGFTVCTFDNAATQGNYVQISSSLAGECHDAGAARPASGQIIGRIWAGVAGNDYTVLLGLDPNAAGGGGTAPSLGSGAVWDPVPFNTLPSGNYTSAPVTNRVAVWKFPLPAAITVTSISFPVVASGNYTAFAIYDNACSALLGQTTPTAIATPAASQSFAFPMSLPAGAYYIAVTSDGTTNEGWSPLSDGGSGSLPAAYNSGSAKDLAFAANPSTGSGAPLAFPSSCGTLTTSGVAIAQVWALRLRQ